MAISRGRLNGSLFALAVFSWSLGACGSPPRPASATPSTASVVAYRFAPVFLQKTSNRQGDGKEFEDHFLRMDFDSDANGFDNWENLSGCPGRKCDLHAFVYCAVRETTKNYYLYYTYFHPRDPKLFLAHENDLEGAMVVVRKRSDGNPLDGTDIALVQAQAHNRWDYGRWRDVCVVGDGEGLPQTVCKPPAPLPAKTHVVLVSQVGRNYWFNQGHGTEIPSRIDFHESFITYVPWTKAGKPPKDSTEAGTALSAPGAPVTYGAPPVTYVLLPFSGDANGDNKLDLVGAFGDPRKPGPWDRRRDIRIYGEKVSPPGHGLQGDDGCKANTPWGWTGAKIPAGMFFKEPAQGKAWDALKKQGVVEDRDAAFEPDPYWKDSNLGLFPNLPRPFQCDCDEMSKAFKDGYATDKFEQGRPCAPGAAASATPAEIVLKESAWDTCDELLAWVPNEAKKLVKEINTAAGCALHVPTGVLLRWPPTADDRPSDRAPGLWLQNHKPIGGVRVFARSVGEPFQLGGFTLQAGVEYDESVEGVEWFKPIVLGPDRVAANFLLSESPSVRSRRPPAVFVIAPDPSEALASGEGPFYVPPGQPWEVDRIELVPERELR